MPGKYEYFEAPGSGHEDVPFEIVEKVVKWFKKHL